MATSLPYLPSYKNVEKLFSSIAAAKVPESFTQNFLAQTLGINSSADRPLIPLMRTLGFIDGSGRPMPQYRELKNPARSRIAIAQAVRQAYAALFDANESADKLPLDQLRGLIAQTAGTDEAMTKKIGYTFSALAKLGDFSSSTNTATQKEVEADDTVDEDMQAPPLKQNARAPGLRTEFHYNLQIHLPANGSEESYLNIFNALRKVFQ